MATKKETLAKTETKFSLKELLKANIFKNRKDAIAVVVKVGEKITIAEAKTRLEKFMKERVK